MGTIAMDNSGIDSVTTLLKTLFTNRLDENQMSFKDRQQLHTSAARRTFMHGLMELIGKESKNGREISAEDLVGTKEYEDLENALRKELGLSATPERIAQMRKRADAAAAVGRAQGLMGKDTFQELNLGGYFTDSTGGVGSRGVKGTADVISYQNGKAVVGDWKFSQDSSPETYMERLL
jgi:hypothetical protein